MGKIFPPPKRRPSGGILPTQSRQAPPTDPLMPSSAPGGSSGVDDLLEVHGQPGAPQDPRQAQGKGRRPAPNPFGAASRAGQQSFGNAPSFGNMPAPASQVRPAGGVAAAPPPTSGATFANPAASLINANPASNGLDTAAIRNGRNDLNNSRMQNDPAMNAAPPPPIAETERGRQADTHPLSEHDAALQGEQDRLARERAEELQMLASQMNLGGMGLAVSSGRALGDRGRNIDEQQQQQLQDYETHLDEQDFAGIQRQAELDDLEMADDYDYNKDGRVGGEKVGERGVGNRNPDDNKDKPGEGPENTLDEHDRALQAEQEKSGGTGAKDDPFGGIGGYGDESEQIIGDLMAGGVTFTAIRAENGFPNNEKYIYALGSDGKYYKFKMPGTGLGHMTTDDEASAWFSQYEGGGA